MFVSSTHNPNRLTIRHTTANDLVRVSAVDTLSISDLRSVYNLLLLNSRRYSECINVIFDCRGVKASFNPNEMSSVVLLLEVVATQFKSIKIAQIHDSPKETACAVFFHKNIQHIKNVHFNVFNLEESARHWLASYSINPAC